VGDRRAQDLGLDLYGWDWAHGRFLGRRCGDLSRLLGGDEPVDPAQVVLGRLAGVVDQGALVPVERAPWRLDRPTAAFPGDEELGAAALQEQQARLGA
jgi:hypothetical protein